MSDLQSSQKEGPGGGPDSSTIFPGRSDQLSAGLALCRSSLGLARAAWADHWEVGGGRWLQGFGGEVVEM